MYPEKTQCSWAGRFNLCGPLRRHRRWRPGFGPETGPDLRIRVVIGGYEYHPGTDLPHRRPLDWKGSINQDDMSPTLASTAAAPMTVFQLEAHAAQLASLTQLTETAQPLVQAISSQVQEQLAFHLEKQLEEFLVHNWAGTSPGREYHIYSEEGQPVGQQYPFDTAPTDILDISKDRTRLLVVELTRGRASDAVVGQIQRYMGYFLDALLEPGQSVEGVIIDQEDDLRIKRACR